MTRAKTLLTLCLTLLLASCVPIVERLVIPVATIRNPSAVQGTQRDCGEVNYGNKRLKMSDSFEINRISLPEGVKASPEVSDTNLLVCFYADLSAIPGTYPIDYKITINGFPYVSPNKQEIDIRSDSFKTYLKFSEITVQKGQSSCSTLEFSPTPQSSWSAIDFDQVKFQIISSGKISGEVWKGSRGAELCAIAPADAFAGNYKLQFRGRAGGIGFNKEFSVKVQ
jgi:hypothetical protein